VPEPPLILVGLNEPERTPLGEPVAGEITDERVTVSVNPFNGATVIVDVLLVPALISILVGLAATVKSCAWNTTIAEVGVGETFELVPVTVAW
jgi:hypothetical protein